MITKKEIILEIEYLLTLKSVMETYEEIAAVRMQRLRSSVLETRNFLLEINNIFQEVKSSYKKELKRLMEKRKIKEYEKFNFVKRNGKTLSVLLSSNTWLYGDIIRRTFNLFADQIRKEQTDVVITGRTGLQLFQEGFPNMPFTYFDLADTKLEEENLKKIVSSLIQYEKVLVFYGQFQSVIFQQPIVSSISGDRLPWEKETFEIKYFFEPSLENILEFFEKEIFSSIFEQTVYESQLARFASRMVALDQASDNTKNRLKQMMFDKEKIRHNLANKKQTEIFASRSLWQEKHYG